MVERTGSDPCKTCTHPRFDHDAGDECLYAWVNGDGDEVEQCRCRKFVS